MDRIFEKLDYPHSLFLESTNHCNLKCSICPFPKMKREKGFMSWNILEEVVEESKGKSRHCFFMGFGEPLLHPELSEMVSYIEGSGIPVSISTNSMLLDEDMVNKLFDAGLTCLLLPLSSLTKSVYESLRVGARLETVVENIDRCIEIRRKRKDVKTRIVMIPIAMKDSIDEFEKIKARYSPRLAGFGSVELKGYCTYSGAVEERAAPNFESPPGFCTMTNYGISIYWDGAVVICCNDYDGFTLVGSVVKNSIETIWSNSQYERYRKSINKKDFSDNPFCGRCLGGLK